ncbi:MAG: hypothetical protein K2P78_09225 [Gemmataceae bacterium]|nr:hypothetical protein [Gemmataceae bacterium]
MDPLLIGLIVLAVIALSGWGYGTYGVRPAAGTTEVVAAPAWATPLGVVGLIVVVGAVVMLVTGWHPIVVAP